MRLDELKVDPFGSEISATQFKHIMSMIKKRGLDSDSRAASIKDSIIGDWQSGHRKITRFEPSFKKLGLDLNSAIREMDE